MPRYLSLFDSTHVLPDAALEDIGYLRSPQAIRERCHQIFERACHHQLEHFDCDLNQLDAVADYVIQVTRDTYPDFKIPFHSRWRHFEVEGADRMARFHQAVQPYDALETARIKIDLATVSVLLDAGAGKDWRYVEPETGAVLSRSEGLAIASFHIFCSGAFSSDPHQPLQADAKGLQAFHLDALKAGFQVTEENPLVGLEGRLHLLHQLGNALSQSPHLFGEVCPRAGHLVDYLAKQNRTSSTSAATILQAVLDGFSFIWPGRITLHGINLGDVWQHPALPQTSLSSSLVPFHKLSQWLTYSLLEPLAEAGLSITDLDGLTGLPEYRNGGLFIDMDVLRPKHPEVTGEAHAPGSSIIVEWRALTVVLLDLVAQRIRQNLGIDAKQLPLACVLQGGTWSAGRRIAGDRRPSGIPPIQIKSDGTVF